MDWNSDGRKDLIVGDTDGFVWIFLNTGTDADPVLAAGKKLQVGGSDFKPDGGRAKPWVVDWNNDGKKDLIVGVESGEVLLLLNTGTDKAPVFAKAVPIKAGAKNLKANMRVCPVVFDWNKDGKKDLLCADEFGNVTYFQNVGSDANPAFDKGVPVKARGWPLSPPAGGMVTADFNGDGRSESFYLNRDGEIQIFDGGGQVVLKVEGRPYKVDYGKVRMASARWSSQKRSDFLLGQEDGRVLLFSAQKGGKWNYTKPVVLQDGNKPLNGGRSPVPSFVDWNKDGKKDLVCYSADGKVYWFENKGTDAEPAFNGRQEAETDFSPIYGGYRSALTVVDWNNDGKSDLVYGVTHNDDNDGYLYVFLAE